MIGGRFRNRPGPLGAVVLLVAGPSIVFAFGIIWCGCWCYEAAVELNKRRAK